MKKHFARLLIFIAGITTGVYIHQYWPFDPNLIWARFSQQSGSKKSPSAEAPPPNRLSPDTNTPSATIDALLENGRYEEAIEFFTRIQTKNVQLATNQLRTKILGHASHSLEIGRHTDAEGLLSLYLEAEFRDPVALEMMANALIARQKYRDAINTLYDAKAQVFRTQDLQRISARIRSVVTEYADLLQRHQNTQGLLALYEMLTHLEPDHSPYFIRLAEAQIDSGDKEGARQSLSLVFYDPVVAEQAGALWDQLAASSPEDEATTAVPVTAEGNQFLIETWANDTARLRLLIDTGASMTIIKPSSLDSAGIRYLDTGQLGWFSTANGVVEASIVRLDTLTLGNQRIGPIDVGRLEIAAPANVDGLLGMNFLQNYEFVIDQAENVLRLSPRF